MIVSHTKEYIKGISDIVKFASVYKKYQDYTMVPEKKNTSNVWLLLRRFKTWMDVLLNAEYGEAE